MGAKTAENPLKTRVSITVSQRMSKNQTLKHFVFFLRADIPTCFTKNVKEPNTETQEERTELPVRVGFTKNVKEPNTETSRCGPSRSSWTSFTKNVKEPNTETGRHRHRHQRRIGFTKNVKEPNTETAAHAAAEAVLQVSQRMSKNQTLKPVPPITTHRRRVVSQRMSKNQTLKPVFYVPLVTTLDGFTKNVKEPNTETTLRRSHTISRV